MKHNIKITLILLGMFLLTQLIGLYVINFYTPRFEEVLINGTIQNVSYGNNIPYGMKPPSIEPEFSIISLLLAITFATALIFLLVKIKAKLIIRSWFFFVVAIGMAISFTALLGKIKYASFIALFIAFILSFFKIYKRDILIHNLTEIFIYPGIAVIFVPILNVWTAVILLLAISVYDAYAVWKAKFMQKLAKYQITELQVFSGFFVPYISKRLKNKIMKMKKLGRKNEKIKVNLAILGGGDIAFPLIFAGVLYRSIGVLSSLIVIATSTIALGLLFILARKGKFYPAMPFLTSGCLIGLGLSFLI